MSSALIGHTGFVGGNILRKFSPDHVFNSHSIEDIRGRRFDMVVCAGTYAEKWRINREPAADLANIERLASILSTVTIGRLVLISTIDVYPVPVNVDEASVIDAASLHPYGRHRLWLEQELSSRFECTVMRLPALFGPGLKKNAIFDLLHGHRIESLDFDAAFQFYDLGRLWVDIETAVNHRLPLVNLSTPPTSLRDVAGEVFGVERIISDSGSASTRYDCWTRHAVVFGGSGHYIADQASVIRGLRAFVEDQRSLQGQDG